MNSLTAAQAIAVYRARYPDGLVCLACGRLLTTDRRRFTRLTDADASAYVCAECRVEAAEAARVAASKVERARRGAATRRQRAPTLSARGESAEDGETGTRNDCAVRTPARAPGRGASERRRASRVRAIEAAGGLDAFRAIERDRKRRRRGRPVEVGA
jgi:hypothetical protein